jgi:two-component system sensor histidine kinase CreC
VQPEHAGVNAEPGLLALAVSNLLENARSFAPPGATVTIEAGEGWVAVTDTGPCVADYALPKLGERFFSTVRPDGHTKGSGLGLAIVRQIMLLHGGQMLVRNMQPGLRVELHF